IPAASWTRTAPDATSRASPSPCRRAEPNPASPPSTTRRGSSISAAGTAPPGRISRPLHPSPPASRCAGRIFVELYISKVAFLGHVLGRMSSAAPGRRHFEQGRAPMKIAPLFRRRAIRVGLLAVIAPLGLTAAAALAQNQQGGEKGTSYSPVVIEEDFDSIRKRL